jgi:hypothetical protein
VDIWNDYTLAYILVDKDALKTLRSASHNVYDGRGGNWAVWRRLCFWRTADDHSVFDIQ